MKPAIIVDPDLNSQIMTQEIFGPLLPVIEVKDVEEAITFINERDKPLSL